MTKRIFISLAAFTAITTSGYAGGDIAPVPVLIPDDSTHEPLPVYLGAGLIWGRYHKDTYVCEYEDVTYGAMVKAGYDWNPYIGIEARYLQTFWDEDDLGGQKLQHFGLFAKPMYPVSENVNIYGLVGYGWTETKTGGNGNLPTVDESGFSAGVGFEYNFSDNKENASYGGEFDTQEDQEGFWGIFVDYQRLLIDSDVPDMDVISIGVTYHF